MKNNKIKFILPNMIESFFINRFFISLQKTQSEYFNENFIIYAVTGTIDYSIWNINRKNKYINFPNFKIIYDFYNKNGIKINFLFDNKFVEEKELTDTFSNLALKYAQNKDNSVSLYSELLGNYIKQKYPLYKIIKILPNDDEKNISVEIDSKYNNSLDINNIKNKEETIITLNPICSPTCELYDIHREYIGKEQKQFYTPSKIFMCPLKGSFCFYDSEKNPNFISNNKLKNYIEAGLQNYRIDSNYISKNTSVEYSTVDIIESYIYYLIKPEFQNEIRGRAMKEYFKSLTRSVIKK